MIKQQELDGKIYKDRECIGFSYWLKVGVDDDLKIEFVYRKQGIGKWFVTAFMPSSGFFGDEVFRDEFNAPDGSPLAYVCAVGLNGFTHAVEDRHEVESAIAMAASTVSHDVIYKPSEARHA